MILMDIDFSPEKSLFSLPIVRWCAGVSAFIAVGISVIIAFNLTEYPIDFSGDGFNKFAEFYKVPAAFLAIGFTLVGLCAANHRSEQTKRQIERTAKQIDLTTTQIGLTTKQIEITKVQNNFSNYYKHIEEFGKFCDIQAQDEFLIKSKRQLYRSIYPNSINGDLTTSIKFIENIKNHLLTIFDISQNFKSENVIERETVAKKISLLNKFFLDNIGISSKRRNSFHIREEDLDAYKMFPHLARIDFLQIIIEIADFPLFLHNILTFDLNYIASNGVLVLKKENLRSATSDLGASEPLDINDFLIYSPTKSFEI